MQAQQQIPDWLEEMSTSTVGVGGFIGGGGPKDSRRGNVRMLDNVAVWHIVVQTYVLVMIVAGCHYADVL